jgi:hypothetical protein
MVCVVIPAPDVAQLVKRSELLIEFVLLRDAFVCLARALDAILPGAAVRRHEPYDLEAVVRSKAAQGAGAVSNALADFEFVCIGIHSLSPIADCEIRACVAAHKRQHRGTGTVIISA